MKTKNIDPLKIIFSQSYQMKEAQLLREQEAEKIIQRKGGIFQ